MSLITHIVCDVEFLSLIKGLHEFTVLRNNEKLIHEYGILVNTKNK